MQPIAQHAEAPLRLEPTEQARFAVGRLADPPRGAPTGEGATQWRRRVALDCAPSDALRRLRPLRAVLLESRTDHPGARYSILPFSPSIELTARGALLTERGVDGGEQAVSEPPWERLTDWFEAVRHEGPAGLPFAGGWCGFLSHEAASWILRTPTPAPNAPARPELPWAHVRLYRDALVIDRWTGEATLVATDFDHSGDAPNRLLRAQELLREDAPRGPAARALDAPTSTLSEAEYQVRVARLQELVRGGDCFQANLTLSFAYPWERPPTDDGLLSLFEDYVASNPGPWNAFYDAPECSILSGSPELLVELRGDEVRLRPIAGTRPRGGDAVDDERLRRELLEDPKERAEHAMLVDLARNDAASICRAGTVQVRSFAGVERYRHVSHLVSEVEGRPTAGLTIRRLLEAVFPGGTVTGAPKRRAVQRIAELEDGPRGPYTGAFGYVSLTGSSQWNLLIRTLVATPTHLIAHAGCGIVEASRPPAELDELRAKARAQVAAALGRATPAPDEALCGRVDAGPRWTLPDTLRPLSGRRVLLVDFEDSFVHNLADYCRRLGAETSVVPAALAPFAAWQRPPTHVILSPGPGRPEDFPQARHHLDLARRAGIPVLGVCLGHQAIAHWAGASVERHPETVHGRSSRIRLTGTGPRDPLLSQWDGRTVARYHSLVARDLPPSLESLAQLDDGTCMALRVRGHPVWGVQFHPESILTERGLDLLRAFLEVGRDG